MTLKDALEQCGYEPRSYSGRGMFGKQCVSVNLDDIGQLFRVGQSVAKLEVTISSPRIDNMGRGVVAYWPHEPWSET
jgi:hypothetical protein